MADDDNDKAGRENGTPEEGASAAGNAHDSEPGAPQVRPPEPPVPESETPPIEEPHPETPTGEPPILDAGAIDRPEPPAAQEQQELPASEVEGATPPSAA